MPREEKPEVLLNKRAFLTSNCGAYFHIYMGIHNGNCGDCSMSLHDGANVVRWDVYAKGDMKQAIAFRKVLARIAKEATEALDIMDLEFIPKMEALVEEYHKNQI